jgi:2-polyprenyl-6-methoxyphenol hydroxylase-like FAD-dependent oxidoreductase
VTVLERADGIAEGGTALGMWPEALAALDELEVGADVRAHAVLSHGAAILDPRGGVLARIPASRRAHLVSRARLLHALHEALPAGTVQWGTTVRSIDDLPESDLIVGADGIHSAVRSALWDRRAQRPLGTVAFRGVVDGDVGSVTETWGEGALFGITPSSDGFVNWFACLRADMSPPAGSDAAAELARRFSAWHPAVAGIVSRVSNDGIDRRELFDVALSHPYVEGTVALVGDAAHAMAPNLGRGACESLIDAVVLARAVSAAPDVPTGLWQYDRARRHRSQRVVRAARALNRIATARRGLGLRNGAMRLLLGGQGGRGTGGRGAGGGGTAHGARSRPTMSA